MKFISVFISVGTFILCVHVQEVHVHGASNDDIIKGFLNKQLDPFNQYERCKSDIAKCEKIVSHENPEQKESYCPKLIESLSCSESVLSKCVTDQDFERFKVDKKNRIQDQCNNGGNNGVGVTSTIWSGFVCFMVALLAGEFV